MNANERMTFIDDLIGSVRADLINYKVDKIPDTWDGEELRRYIADRFEAETNLLARGKVRQNGCTKRLAAYHAAIVLRDL